VLKVTTGKNYLGGWAKMSDTALTGRALAYLQALSPGLKAREDLTESNAMVLESDCRMLALYDATLLRVELLEASDRLSYELPNNGCLAQHPDAKTLRELRTIVDKIERRWGLTPYDLAMLREQEQKAALEPPNPEDAEFDALQG